MPSSDQATQFVLDDARMMMIDGDSHGAVKNFEPQHILNTRLITAELLCDIYEARTGAGLTTGRRIPLRYPAQIWLVVNNRYFYEERVKLCDFICDFVITLAFIA